MSTSREAILARVRHALAPLPSRASLPDWDAALLAQRKTGGETNAWQLFAERLRAAHGTPLDSAAELADYLATKEYLHGYCDPAIWPKLAPAFSAAFKVETTFDRARIDDYRFGITVADGAIAETGTLILSDAATSSRLAALAPWVHVAVVPSDRIFADLPTAIAALPADPNVIWVTGPSKTADVEGILIEGVHGPGEQLALPLAADA